MKYAELDTQDKLQRLFGIAAGIALIAIFVMISLF